MQKSDHDLLIRLEAKVDALITTITEFKDGTAVKLTELRTDVDDLKQWRHDFRLTWKVLIGIAAGIGGLVGFVLSSLNDIMALIGKR